MPREQGILSQLAKIGREQLAVWAAKQRDRQARAAARDAKRAPKDSDE